ncbi:MAG TPA: hypothetical protein PLK99_06400 [Burkholderiales bacterium]|nr:hypothetical protein [Burkholderiales bacterium]
MMTRGWGLLFLILSGCVVAPAPYYATMPPPAPREEFIGAAPAVGYIWIGGYWNWVGGRYVWARGHWEPPRPGYRWMPHHWVQEGNRWHHRGGRWERER